MAKIDVFNMCYGVGAVNPFDCLMRQKSKESNSRRDLLYGMMKAARTAWEKWMEANPEEWKKIVQEMRQEDQKFVCTLVLERRIEEVDDDYAEWKTGERGW